jgi:hypothetical protein
MQEQGFRTCLGILRLCRGIDAARAEARTGHLPCTSFDDLVGSGENSRRDRQAELLGGLKIDHQLEPRRSLYRQVGRTGTARTRPT